MGDWRVEPFLINWAVKLAPRARVRARSIIDPKTYLGPKWQCGLSLGHLLDPCGSPISPDFQNRAWASVLRALPEIGSVRVRV